MPGRTWIRGSSQVELSCAQVSACTDFQGRRNLSRVRRLIWIEARICSHGRPWLRRLSCGISGVPLTVCQVSQLEKYHGAIEWAKNLMYTFKSRHIDMMHHFHEGVRIWGSVWHFTRSIWWAAYTCCSEKDTLQIRFLLSRGRSGECLMCLQQGRGWCCIADVGDVYLDDEMIDFYDCRSAEPSVVLGNRHMSIADWRVIYR